MPFAILGNKIDKGDAASEQELIQSMELFNQTTGKGTAKGTLNGVRPLETFMCSVQNEMGYGDAFKWLGKNLQKQ